MSAQPQYQPAPHEDASSLSGLEPIRESHDAIAPVHPLTTPHRTKAIQNVLTSRRVQDHMPLILTVARVEMNRHPQYILDFGDLVSIAAMTLFNLLTQHPERPFNSHYLSNAMKWGIRNELRSHYRWYALKKGQPESSTDDETTLNHPNEGAAGASSVRYGDVVTSLLSFDDATDTDPLHDNVNHVGQTPEQLLDQHENTLAIQAALKTLPDRERQILEARFFRNLKMREIALSFDISPSRASRIIQASLLRIKKELQRVGYAF
jgi:RNA polymerase sigma factor (sigma-70 family)